MAKKNCGHIHKETGNHNRKQEDVSDEIALRDEILDLKRQVMILKRTNERYSVRLRKYEDEAKRKDKQLEQLMNPRKNADITRVLSTKGAAILMNLKDQNNALIQMLLNKDLHIRRLAAEVKMSKLYASSKRNECYKAEISRLRNLLMKSEEMLRENIEVQQEQTRSICVGENPIPESSSSSDQSSSRDLDALRYTILSLESHIKYSNELLAQKNQEISLLSDELNFLKRCIRYKKAQSEVFDCDNSTPQKLSTAAFTRSWTDPVNLKNLSSQDLLDFFERTPGTGPLPHSAPAAPTALVPSYSSTPDHRLPVTVIGDHSENRTAAAVIVRADLEYSTVSTNVSKSLFHNLATEEILKAEKTLSRARKPLYTKGKWKQAFTKYKELKKLNPRLITGGEQNPKSPAESGISSKFSDLETRELEVREKDFEREGGRASPINEEITFRAVERPKSGGTPEKAEGLEPIIKPSQFSMANTYIDDNMSSPCQTFENCSVSNKIGKCSKAELSPSNKSESTDKEPDLVDSSPARRELETSFQNHSEEFKQKDRKPLREVYCQSLDSSFDSENNYSMKQEFRQIQVEIHNAVPLQNYSDHLENSNSEISTAYEFGEETGGNDTPDFEFNDDDDDDDVVVR